MFIFKKYHPCNKRAILGNKRAIMGHKWNFTGTLINLIVKLVFKNIVIKFTKM